MARPWTRVHEHLGAAPGPLDFGMVAKAAAGRLAESDDLDWKEQLPQRPREGRTFEETVQLLELFLHREGRVPAARETVRVDGDTSSSAPGSPRPAPSTVLASSLRPTCA